jgi:hypothetical protein
MCEATAVDVEGFENVEDAVDGEVKLTGPADNVEVFLAGFQSINYAVEENLVFGERAVQEAEITAVEFHPESAALQMFEPTRPQIPVPMLFDPPADCLFALITASALALDPLEAVDFELTGGVDRMPFHVRVRFGLRGDRLY